MNNAGIRWSGDQLKEYIDAGRQEIERQIGDVREQVKANTVQLNRTICRDEYHKSHEALRSDLKEAQEGLRRDLERAQDTLRMRIEEQATTLSTLTGSSAGRTVTWQLVVAALSAAVAVVMTLVGFHAYLTR